MLQVAEQPALAGRSPSSWGEGLQAGAGLHVGVQVVYAFGQVVHLQGVCMARAGGSAQAAQLLQCRAGTARDPSPVPVAQQKLLRPALCTEA